MEDLNYLEYVRARAEEKLVVAENDARYQRAIVAAMDDKIAALKAPAPETGYACPHWKPGVATLRDHCTACEAEARQK